MITKPTLPPKSGYIEAQTPDGRSEYRKIQNQELENLSTQSNLLSAQVQAQTERSDFIEDCIAEMATQVYAE